MWFPALMLFIGFVSGLWIGWALHELLAEVHFDWLQRKKPEPATVTPEPEPSEASDSGWSVLKERAILRPRLSLPRPPPDNPGGQGADTGLYGWFTEHTGPRNAPSARDEAIVKALRTLEAGLPEKEDHGSNIGEIQMFCVHGDRILDIRGMPVEIDLLLEGTPHRLGTIQENKWLAVPGDGVTWFFREQPIPQVPSLEE